MTDDEMSKDLHKLLEDRALEKGYSRREVLAFLSICFTGTLAMEGYSDAFVDLTFKRMRMTYLKQKLRLQKEAR